MRLDVIIPTYNRHEMLRRTLNSLLAAEVPHGLDVRVTVVDNNSTDQTRQTVEDYTKRFGGRPALCETIRIGDFPYTVIGLMEFKEQHSSYDGRDVKKV